MAGRFACIRCTNAVTLSVLLSLLTVILHVGWLNLVQLWWPAIDLSMLPTQNWCVCVCFKGCKCDPWFIGVFHTINGYTYLFKYWYSTQKYWHGDQLFMQIHCYSCDCHKQLLHRFTHTVEMNVTCSDWRRIKISRSTEQNLNLYQHSAWYGAFFEVQKYKELSFNVSKLIIYAPTTLP